MDSNPAYYSSTTHRIYVPTFTPRVEEDVNGVRVLVSVNVDVCIQFLDHVNLQVPLADVAGRWGEDFNGQLVALGDIGVSVRQDLRSQRQT